MKNILWLVSLTLCIGAFCFSCAMCLQNINQQNEIEALQKQVAYQYQINKKYENDFKKLERIVAQDVYLLRDKK